MGKSYDEMLAKFSKEDQEYIQKRGDELIEEYETLQELRKAMKLSQEHVAKILEVRQENISRLEKCPDLMLSTLKKYISALGGDLKIIVKFPDKPDIVLTAYDDIVDSNTA